MTELGTGDGELIRTISPNDEMFTNEAHYFYSGENALTNIENALTIAEFPSPPKRILDFPCGHGRVLRYLRARYPNAEITACDLNRDGVDFCEATFGAIPVYSDNDPSVIPLPKDTFDLIWVGSLLTHFDHARWTQFLTFFRSLLKPGGMLVFSTHGRYTFARMVDGEHSYAISERDFPEVRDQFESCGFGYADYDWSPNYGSSFATAAWVCQLLASIPDFRLIACSELAWDKHHDIFACIRDAGLQIPGSSPARFWRSRCTPLPIVIPRPSQVAPPSESMEPEIIESLPETPPVRYRVADALNRRIKRFRRAHGMARSLVRTALRARAHARQH
jgi:SAM-dependent methyltransferase